MKVKPFKRLWKIILHFINPRLKSWVNKKKVKALNRFNGLPWRAVKFISSWRSDLIVWPKDLIIQSCIHPPKESFGQPCNRILSGYVYNIPFLLRMNHSSEKSRTAIISIHVSDHRVISDVTTFSLDEFIFSSFSLFRRGE